MNWLLWVFPAAAALVFLIGLLTAQLFRARRIPHRKTPDAYDIDFEEISIPATDGGSLYAWWIPGDPKQPALVLVHGWNGNLGRFMRFIRKLNFTGYNLLAFDARGHGSSSDLRYPTVWTFTEDTLAAVRYLRETKHPGWQSIGLIGHSIGGGAVINSAAQDEGILAAATIGAFTHPIAVMRADLRKRHIPYFPFAWLFFQYYRVVNGVNFDRIAPVNNISSAKGAILLIHGKKDEQVPFAQAEELASAARTKKVELWALEDHGHNDCHQHPRFWDKMITFFNQNVS